MELFDINRCNFVQAPLGVPFFCTTVHVPRLLLMSLFTEALVELMVTVVELNPNCCKSSHLPVLFAAYSASLSTTGENAYSK